VFYVNVPIGIAAFLFGLVFVKHHAESHPGAFDLPGFLLSGIGLALLMYGVSEGPSIGWGTARVLVTAIAGAALLAVMVAVELRTPEPIVALRLLVARTAGYLLRVEPGKLDLDSSSILSGEGRAALEREADRAV
jgi:hypothetical protein